MSGSVRVVSDGPIGGILRFDIPGIGVAAVGASQAVRDAIFPARRQAGGISTGAAIHNLGEEALVVSCQLMKDGAVLEEEEIPLEANGQEARYIEEMFTSTDTSDFVGSVRCTAPPGEGVFTRSGRGTRCGQPHLYDTAGGTGGGNAESGGAMKSSVLMHLTLKRRAHQHQNRGMVNDIRHPGIRASRTFCSSTFSAAWTGCGRIFLGLLAVLSAALPTVFTVVTAVMLASLLTATAEGQADPEPCSGGGFNPTPTAVEVDAVPIVVESTTDDYFVLYVKHDVDGAEVELPVLVKLGESATTTLAENVEALPKERYRVRSTSSRTRPTSTATVSTTSRNSMIWGP